MQKICPSSDCEASRRHRHFALILAAGYSTRMGTCKTTLLWHDNQTLLRYQAKQFLLAGITPIIVLGSHNAHRQVDCPDGSHVIINYRCDNPSGTLRKRGKTESILTGLKLIPPDFSTITISAVDQPRSANIYQTLLKIYRQKRPAIVAPCYRQKLGHPLLFSARLLPELKNISESTFGLRKIVKDFYSSIEKIEFSTPEVLRDLNYLTEYQQSCDTVLNSKDNRSFV